MTITPRLDIERQSIVTNAVEVTLEAPRATPLLPATRARGEALVAAGVALRLFTALTAQRVDQATDTVIVAFRSVLEDQARALRDSVVVLAGPQREAVGRLGMLRTRLFPNGTGFIRWTMDLQWSQLLVLRSAMEDPEVAAAIDAQGLRALADHLLAHIALYGRMLGHDADTARAGQEEASAAWSEAMTMFAAQVLIDYEKDEEMRTELLGAYKAQLEQQRAGYRAAARARRASAKARGKGAAAGAEGSG